MNMMPIAKRVMVLKCLTEGMSIRATSRVTGASKGAVLRLLEEAGEFCEGYAFYRLWNLPTWTVEVDEQWSHIRAKARNATIEGHGDIWTYRGIDADSKFVMSWLVGARNQANAREFMVGLADRCKRRIQLSTDRHGMYTGAVRAAFGLSRVDCGRIVKVFGHSQEQGPARRYSPPVVIGTIKERMVGRPDMVLVSTSYVERLNLDTRQQCRRFTRLTNGFSKKAENHAHAVALHFFAHDFCRAHGTLTKKAGVKALPRQRRRA